MSEERSVQHTTGTSFEHKYMKEYISDYEQNRTTINNDILLYTTNACYARAKTQQQQKKRRKRNIINA